MLQWEHMSTYGQEALKLAFEAGRSIQFYNDARGDWTDTKNPSWCPNIAYRVKPEEQVNWTIDGLEAVPWIKQERARTGCGLKEAKDKWDALKAAGKRSSVDTAQGGYLCTIVEADVENDRLVIQMQSKDYQIGPGRYKLVRVS